MSEQLNRIEDMLGQLIKIVGETNAKVVKIEQDLQETNRKLESTNQKLESTNQRLESTAMELRQEMRDMRQELGGKIDKLTEGQERHERILEVLSKRSIEQESYIRRSL